MKSNGIPSMWVAILVGLLAIGWLSCGRKLASPQADASELERAFALKAGVAPAAGTPADLAAQAVAAIRAQEWVKAIDALEKLRANRSLTADQMHAVHNASGNAVSRVVELAGQGNAEAQAFLDRARQKADKR